MEREAEIVGTCECNFAYAETGFGVELSPGDYHPIIQMMSPRGSILYSNLIEDEEMDDLDMNCIRCGKTARWR